MQSLEKSGKAEAIELSNRLLRVFYVDYSAPPPTYAANLARDF